MRADHFFLVLPTPNYWHEINIISVTSLFATIHPLSLGYSVADYINEKHKFAFLLKEQNKNLKFKWLWRSAHSFSTVAIIKTALVSSSRHSAQVLVFHLFICLYSSSFIILFSRLAFERLRFLLAYVSGMMCSFPAYAKLSYFKYNITEDKKKELSDPNFWIIVLRI